MNAAESICSISISPVYSGFNIRTERTDFRIVQSRQYISRTMTNYRNNNRSFGIFAYEKRIAMP